MLVSAYLNSTRYFRNWYLLAFSAGAINAGGLLAAHSFVTHVTGFATDFGIALTEGKWLKALGIFSVPGYFLLGAMFSAALTERRIRRGRVPMYGWTVFSIFLCLLVIVILGETGYLGAFGTKAGLRNSYIVLALLCAASGMQNAVVTNYSGAVVRTTHLTGITTDLGIGIVVALDRWLSGDRSRLRTDFEVNRMRALMIASFVLGSVVGAFACMRFGYRGFLIPMLITLHASFAAFLTWQKPLLRPSDNDQLYAMTEAEDAGR